jgi:hypothetical protein
MLRALDAERLATAHMRAGRYDAAHHAYLQASIAWRDKADRAARYGETSIADTFLNEARKNEARGRRALSWLMCESGAVNVDTVLICAAVLAIIAAFA